jgi:uncharacterized membrane protein YeaQ/YmgE (transglycosylase-associated protein family)
MEVVLIVTFGGLLGLALRYIVPGREHHGFAVMPSAGVIFGSLGWLFAIWVGLDASGPWGWVVALGLAVVGTVALGIVLPRRRTQEDDALWSELTSS